MSKSNFKRAPWTAIGTQTHRERVHSSSSSSSSSSESHFYDPPPDDDEYTSSDSSSSSSSTSSSSDDDEDANTRVKAPCWEAHRALLQRRGFRLDTYRDVKSFYERYWADHPPPASLRDTTRPSTNTSTPHPPPRDLALAAGYMRACRGGNGRDGEDGLCRDAGLPENLFRGTRIRDGAPIVVKAVHIRSRELAILRKLSSLPLRQDPANHTIPVYDLIEAPDSDLAFLVQAEWSPHLFTAPCSCTPRDFLRALRACIEGLAFMHAHRVAHLDLSLRNLLVDSSASAGGGGRYAFIDFETSRCFPLPPPPSQSLRSNTSSRSRTDSKASSSPRIGPIRATEVPPELERGGGPSESDPFKVDIWQLGMLIVNATKLAGYETLLPELAHVVRPMLHPSFESRPSAKVVLQMFDRMMQRISAQRLHVNVHTHANQ